MTNLTMWLILTVIKIASPSSMVDGSVDILAYRKLETQCLTVLTSPCKPGVEGEPAQTAMFPGFLYYSNLQLVVTLSKYIHETITKF